MPKFKKHLNNVIIFLKKITIKNSKKLNYCLKFLFFINE